MSNGFGLVDVDGNHAVYSHALRNVRSSGMSDTSTMAYSAPSGMSFMQASMVSAGMMMATPPSGVL